jgi:hypothetical protein
MQYWTFLFALLSAHAYADPSAPVIPLNQNITAVDYVDNGQQTGCGLRATGETSNDLQLNVLVTVFTKGSGASFGVIKIVARKMDTKDGKPVLKDGKITYADIGNIEKAWIFSASGKRPLIYKNGESAHADAYMVTADFSSTLDMLVALLQENLTVGISRNEDDPGEEFLFDKRVAPDEAYKLSVCMKNLRAAMDEGKSKEMF